jgi:hypothetical protein
MALDFGSDEHRAIEGIAALLDLMPRFPGESDDDLAGRMAVWAMEQGPNVRYDAVLYATHAMIAKLDQRLGFMRLSEVGLRALSNYNESGRA